MDILHIKSLQTDEYELDRLANSRDSRARADIAADLREQGRDPSIQEVEYYLGEISTLEPSTMMTPSAIYDISK